MFLHMCVCCDTTMASRQSAVDTELKWRRYYPCHCAWFGRFLSSEVPLALLQSGHFWNHSCLMTDLLYWARKLWLSAVIAPDVGTRGECVSQHPSHGIHLVGNVNWQPVPLTVRISKPHLLKYDLWVVLSRCPRSKRQSLTYKLRYFKHTFWEQWINSIINLRTTLFKFIRQPLGLKPLYLLAITPPTMAFTLMGSGHAFPRA